MKCLLLASGGLVLAVAMAGCGVGGPKLVPVSGTVTLNDKPLGSAELTFVPDPANAVLTQGSDVTGPEGNYKARYNARFGLTPGKYKVLISKKAEPVGVELPPEIAMDRVQQEMMGIRKETLPTQYTDTAKSTETITVTEDGENVFDFDVKASGKSGATSKS